MARFSRSFRFVELIPFCIGVDFLRANDSSAVLIKECHSETAFLRNGFELRGVYRKAGHLDDLRAPSDEVICEIVIVSLNGGSTVILRHVALRQFISLEYCSVCTDESDGVSNSRSLLIDPGIGC